MTDGAEPTLETIWSDDKLGRLAEAQPLQGFLESMGSTKSPSGSGSFVLALDAGYGEGKTFFLTRFAKQLQLNHPVAYVDAWKDDLANDPLAAIVATFQEAFVPLLTNENIKRKFDDFVQQIGRVGVALSKGLARRALSFVLTEVGVNAVAEATGASGQAAETSKMLISKAADEAVASQRSRGDQTSLADRVASFREGQRAMSALRQSLSALIESLEGHSKHAPIIVVIDELDRCRPTYAVELLEQVKHLFDVPGMVFILGMHGEQLVHSVGSLYGASFDGRGYLNRFFDRAYRLHKSPQKDMVEDFIRSEKLDVGRIKFPPLSVNGFSGPSDAIQIISGFTDFLALSPRESLRLVHALAVILAGTKGADLLGVYLIPLLAARIKTGPNATLADLGAHAGTWAFTLNGFSPPAAQRFTCDAMEIAKGFEKYASLGEQDFRKAVNSGLAEYIITTCQRYDEGLSFRNLEIARPKNYRELCNFVCRFEN